MKEIKAIEPVYIEKYDIKINRYLTYAQIQQIVEAIKSLGSWSEREQAIDMLMLYHATDAKAEELEKIGHDTLLESGLIDTVRQNVLNIGEVYEAIDYTESIQRSLAIIVKELPKYFEPLEKVIKKHGNKT